MCYSAILSKYAMLSTSLYYRLQIKQREHFQMNSIIFEYAVLQKSIQNVWILDKRSYAIT